MIFLYPFVSTVLFGGLAFGNVQLLNISLTQSGWDYTCVGVLNQQVVCDPALAWAGSNGRFEDSSTLSTVCTSTCTASLATWLRRANGACSAQVVAPDGSTFLPSMYVEAIVEDYNVLCLQSGGNFCNSVLGQLAGIDPSDQSSTAAPMATATCDDCFLKEISTMLQMPLASNSDLASTYNQLMANCSKTFATTPMTGTITYVSRTAPATPTCSGSSYTIQTGDTCSSVSFSQGIDTAGLLAANNLGPCSSFPQSGSLCIPTASKCTVYTVQAGDTCGTIADAHSVLFSQIVSWNPMLNEDCGAIAGVVGMQICISTPGGGWVNPSPTTTVSITFTMPSWASTAATLLPTPTLVSVYNGTLPVENSTWYYHYANGTRLDCYTYANATAFNTTNSTCTTLAYNYGVNVTDLQFWNPMLNSAICSLDPTVAYCTQLMQVNATNMTPTCVWWDTPDPGDTCDDFLAVWGLGLDDFSSWNLDVGSACENWRFGVQYCVGVNGFKQPNITANCNQFVLANDSNVHHDACGLIETPYGISHNLFVEWNPAVGAACTGVRYHYDYCVSTPGFTPTYTSEAPRSTFSLPSNLTTSSYSSGSTTSRYSLDSTTSSFSSTVSPTATSCALVGYDNQSPVSFETSSDPAYLTVSGCQGFCAATAGCNSFGVGSGSDAICLLYTSYVSQNFNANSASPYTFYDATCPVGTGGSSSSCGLVGYDNQNPVSFETSSDPAYLSASGCQGLCTATSGCNSFGVGSGDSALCLLYTSQVSQNFNANSASPYTFWDATCTL